MSRETIKLILGEAQRKILDETGVKVQLCIDAKYLENIEKLVAPFLQAWGVPLCRLQSAEGFRPLTIMRYLLAFYLRYDELVGLKDVAGLINRSMATVVYGLGQIKAWYDTGDEMFFKYYDKVKHLIDEKISDKGY